jgi:hypothetical protein
MPGELPNLLIAGVTRAGTTSLFQYLAQHPEIFPARIKEPDYFTPVKSGDHPMSFDEYRRLFAGARDERYRMEASAGYFFGGPEVLANILTTLPEPRAIVSLRDPVERVWSIYHYKISRSVMEDSVGFDEFLDRCEEVLRLGRDATVGSPYRPLITGAYADFLPEWVEAFGPRLRVLLFDDVQKRPQETVRELLAWLELEADHADEFSYGARNPTIQTRSVKLLRLATAVNRLTGQRLTRHPLAQRSVHKAFQQVAGRKTAKTTMDDAARARLNAIFAEPNQRLAEQLTTLGYVELPNWLAPGTLASQPAVDRGARS